MGKVTQTTSGVTVGNIAVFADVFGNIKDGGANVSDVLNTITLTGQATGSGTGSIAVTLTNSAVISKVLTGYTSGAGVVAATDTILQAIQKLNGNAALLTGAIVYQGTWNASTNTPTLASGVGIKGTLYKVSVAGTTSIDGLDQWYAGDCIVFNGTTWDKLDGLAYEVFSVAGRTGAVTLSNTDISGLGTAATQNTGTSGATIPLLNGANTVSGVNTHTAAIITTPTALSNAGTISTNAALANVFSTTLVNGANTMSAPTNPVDGQVITYELLQPASGAAGTVSWNAAFAFGAAGAPTLSVTNGLYDVLAFRYSSRKGAWLYLGSQLGF